jgi:hypothetical protein
VPRATQGREKKEASACVMEVLGGVALEREAEAEAEAGEDAEAEEEEGEAEEERSSAELLLAPSCAVESGAKLLVKLSVRPAALAVGDGGLASGACVTVALPVSLPCVSACAASGMPAPSYSAARRASSSGCGRMRTRSATEARRGCVEGEAMVRAGPVAMRCSACERRGSRGGSDMAGTRVCVR